MGKVATSMLILYHVFFGFGYSSVPWVYSAEVSSLGWRTRGAAAATSINWLGGFVVVQFTKVGLENLQWRFFLSKFLVAMSCQFCLRGNIHTTSRWHPKLILYKKCLRSCASPSPLSSTSFTPKRPIERSRIWIRYSFITPRPLCSRTGTRRNLNGRRSSWMLKRHGLPRRRITHQAPCHLGTRRRCLLRRVLWRYNLGTLLRKR